MAEGQKPVALITGGRQGLGRGCANALADKGFDLVLIDLVEDATGAQTVADLRQKGAQVQFLRGDISALDSHAELAQQSWDCFGRIDCLVNNAGVAPRQLSDVLSLSPDAFEHNLGVNLRGTFFFAQAVGRLMVANPPDEDVHRSMVFVTSIAANHVSTAIPEYCISKAGLSMVAGLFALTLAAQNIHVYELRPGFIKTEMTTQGEGSPTEAIEAHIAAGHVPMNRWGMEDDVGKATAMLAAGELPYSVAHPIYVDGGYGIRTA